MLDEVVAVLGARPDTAHDAGRECRLVLLAVLVFPDADDVEVHLTRGDQRRSGGPRRVVARSRLCRRPSRRDGILCRHAVRARLGAHDRDHGTEPFLVAVALYAPGTQVYRYGLAAGDSEPDAAVRATLHALNRVLALVLQAG